MFSINQLIVWCCIISAIHCTNYTLFVSKYGEDHSGCGSSKYNSCGTLYYISEWINNEIDSNTSLTIQITINVDGQNTLDIIKYKTLNNTRHYSPCLPTPFANFIDISIVFNETSIKTMNDWYPRNICFGNYKNEYMFDGAHRLKLENFIIINN
eukprot:449733_1